MSATSGRARRGGGHGSSAVTWRAWALCGRVEPRAPSGAAHGIHGPMYVAALYARMEIPGARSLKDKRQIVRSVLDRARSRYHLAAAEVGANDLHQIAELGFANVANTPAAARAPLETVLDSLRLHPVARLLDHELDVT